MNVPFDTLDYAKKLETAGLPTAQAEQQSKLLAEVLSKSIAFPSDLVSLERNVVNKIDASTLKLEAKIEAVRLHHEGRFVTMNWMLTTLIALNMALVLKVFLS
jgi:hypothetical protein